MSEDSKFRERPSAQALADALRAQHALRFDSVQRDPAIPARLRQLGDIESIPPVAKPGAGAPFIKLARRGLRILLRPWLAVQTLFNHDLVRRLQELERDLVELERRTPRIEESMHHIERRLQSVESAIPSVAVPAEETLVDIDAIERAFIHSRVPGPPGRVRVVGTACAAVRAELTTFGFDSREPGPGAPLEPSSLDAMILLLDQPAACEAVPLLAEATGLVKPGGDLIAIRSGAEAPRIAADLVSAGFQQLEVMTADRTGGVWRVASGLRDDAAVLLIHARRLHAPAR